MSLIRQIWVSLLLCVSLIGVLSATASGDATPAKTTPIKVELRQSADGGWQLYRDGKPYFIQGGGGDASKEMLAQMGGNSFRTWGGDDIDDKLDQAQKLGLSVTVGFWMGHERHGFNYNDADQVYNQYENAKKLILKYRNHPAVLMWAIGNEMEGYKDGDNPAIWYAINSIAGMAHKLDPNHPTMTVVAEVGGKRVQSIHRFCPEIDVVGINSYAGGASIPERYRAAGGTKPFVLTEYGPPGTWEMPKNSLGVPDEPTSTAKALYYKSTYAKAIASERGKLCLGGYAFTWGFKNEATATWFGLFLPDGSKLEGVDLLSEMWTGKPPASRCPQIESYTLAGDNDVKPGTQIHAKLAASSPQGTPLTVKWLLILDPMNFNTGGDAQAAAPTFPDAITASDNNSATVTMPKGGGVYRLFAYIYDGKGSGAVANLPIRVDAPVILPPAVKAALPFQLYVGGLKEWVFIPSGFMGNHAGIKLEPNSPENPKVNSVSLKCEYTAKDGWAGVVWQNPANNWGDAPGGRDLTGATKLTFWARGAEGGEKVKFLFGLLGKDKTNHDSAKGEIETVLTPEWKQYTIDLGGKDLSHVMTPFAYVIGGKGKPVTFFLDDVKYE